MARTARTWAALVAAGSVSLASCAFGTQDFVAPGAGGPATIDGDDATAPSPEVDAGKGGAKHDARAPGDASDAAVYHDDAGEVRDATLNVDTSVPDPPDTGVDAGGSDSGSTCAGLPQWFAGTTAPKVQHLGEEYTCKVEGWCSESTSQAVAAYEPGKGWAWTDAWDDSGPCP